MRRVNKKPYFASYLRQFDIFGKCYNSVFFGLPDLPYNELERVVKTRANAFNLLEVYILQEARKLNLCKTEENVEIRQKPPSLTKAPRRHPEEMQFEATNEHMKKYVRTLATTDLSKKDKPRDEDEEIHPEVSEFVIPVDIEGDETKKVAYKTAITENIAQMKSGDKLPPILFRNQLVSYREQKMAKKVAKEKFRLERKGKRLAE